MQNTNLTLGQRIKKYRVINKFSQIQLAKKLNVTQSAVSKWELDIFEPDSETLKKIATLFHISTDKLLNHSLSNPETDLSVSPTKKDLLKTLLEQHSTSIMFASGSSIDELDDQAVELLLEELAEFLDVKVAMKSKK